MTNHYDVEVPEIDVPETKSSGRVSTAFISVIGTIIAGIVLFLITSAGARSDARNEVITATRIDVAKLQQQFDTLKAGQEQQKSQIEALDEKIDSMAVDLKELVSRPHSKGK